MQSSLCPFCGPSVSDDTFEESHHFRAIYNIAPILPGHALVIPKRHVSAFLELTDDEACEMTLFSRQVVALLTDVFSSSGFNWTIQQGESAGQTVEHLHLHLIPRSDGDLPHPGDWYPRLKEAAVNTVIDSEERPRLSVEERRAVVSRLRAAARAKDKSL